MMPRVLAIVLVPLRTQRDRAIEAFSSGTMELSFPWQMIMPPECCPEMTRQSRHLLTECNERRRRDATGADRPVELRRQVERVRKIAVADRFEKAVEPPTGD